MPIKKLGTEHIEVSEVCEGCVYLIEGCAYDNQPVDGCWYPEED